MRRILESYREAFRGLPREVWLLSAVSLVNRSGTMVLPFLVLYLTREKGYAPTEAGAMLALYGVGSIAGISLGGWLTDRIGWVRVLFASLVLGGLTFLVLGRLESAPAIGVAIVVLSLVSEAFRPANSTAVAAFSTPAQRPRAFGLHRLAINVGWTIGPAFGGFLAMSDYGLLFLVDGATCLAAAGFLLLWFRGSVPRRGATRDSDRGPSPWVDRLFVSALGLLLLQAVVFFQIQSTFPLFLRELRGFSEGLVGSMIAVNTVLIVLFEMVLLKRIEHCNPLKVIGVAGLFIGLGFGLLPFGTSIPYVMATVVVWTIGEMLGMPMLTAFVANRADDRNRGRYMGALGTCYSVAAVVAPFAGTAVYQHLGSETLWGGCIAIGVLDLVGFLLLASMTPRRSI